MLVLQTIFVCSVFSALAKKFLQFAASQPVLKQVVV
jgi:hypothetical protein